MLVKIATSCHEQQHPINYACLSDTIYNIFKDNFNGTRPSHRRLGESLGNIVGRCKDAGLPLLPALVINVQKHIPGDGFYEAFLENPNAGSLDRKIKIKIARDQRHLCYKPQPWNELLKHDGPHPRDLFDINITLAESFYSDQRLKELD